MAALIAWLPIVRVDDLVKDRRPPEAAALRAVLDKIINTHRNAVQAIKAALWAFQKPGSLAADGINYRLFLAGAAPRCGSTTKRLETPCSYRRVN
jgi:hypothetical protein